MYKIKARTGETAGSLNADQLLPLAFPA